MIHEIVYNNQRDNVNFKGKFSGYAQCFSTCAWMFMSYYSLEIDAANDKDLAKYVDDVEATVGNEPGLAEELEKTNRAVHGRTSLFWDVQKAGIEKWLKGIPGKSILDLKAKYTDLKDIIREGPVIIGTLRFGRLPGGHIVLGVGFDDIHIICHDPFGDANTDYKDRNGKYVYYEDSLLKKYFRKRILYWSE